MWRDKIRLETNEISEKGAGEEERVKKGARIVPGLCKVYRRDRRRQLKEKE